MVVLKAGDWVICKKSLVWMCLGAHKGNRVLVERLSETNYKTRQWKIKAHLTKLDESLYAILSDSISNKEEL